MVRGCLEDLRVLGRELVFPLAVGGGFANRPRFCYLQGSPWAPGTFTSSHVAKVWLPRHWKIESELVKLNRRRALRLGLSGAWSPSPAIYASGASARVPAVAARACSRRRTLSSASVAPPVMPSASTPLHSTEFFTPSSANSSVFKY